MVILKATSFLEGHKRDMGMTFRITPCIYEGEKGKNLFGALKLKPLLRHIFFVVLT